MQTLQTSTEPNIRSASDYEESLKQSNPDFEIKRVFEAPLDSFTVFEVIDPNRELPKIITYLPPLALIAATFHTEESENPLTLLGPNNFPSERILENETVEQCAVRFMTKTVSVIDPSWIESVHCLGLRYPNSSFSTERHYGVHLEVNLPEEVSTEELKSRIIRCSKKSSSIRDSLEVINVNLLSEVTGSSDSFLLAQLLELQNPFAAQGLYGLGDKQAGTALDFKDFSLPGN